MPRTVETPLSHPPAVGSLELLVYGECACGWRCACHEGALWPVCPSCGKQVCPPPPHVARDQRLGCVAWLMNEQEAVARVRAADEDAEAVDRHYSAELIERWADG